jgi:hypothetical protein
MAEDPAAAVRAAMEANRRAALDIVQAAGVARTQDLLRRSAADLEARLRQVSSALGEESYTVVQMRATLAHVRATLRAITLPGIKNTVVAVGGDAAQAGAAHTTKFLTAAERAYRGSASQHLALREAAMMDEGVVGARASVLRRLATGVERRRRPMTKKRQPVRRGILARYGMEVIKEFEQTLQTGLVAKKSWIDMRADITKKSPFLQGKPNWWAHRIVRTEVMSSYNAANHHVIVAASKQLDGMLMILSATFDDRTAADSYADHGEVRRPGEPFESWYGEFEHPPDRSNDRGTVVPHRERWGPVPDELQPMSEDEVAEQWAKEGRKGKPPERPLMSTVPGFGEVP